MTEATPEPAPSAPRRTWQEPPPDRKRAVIVWSIIGVVIVVILYFSWGILGNGSTPPPRATAAERALRSYDRAWNAGNQGRLRRLTCTEDRTGPIADPRTSRYTNRIRGSQKLNTTMAIVRGTFIVTARTGTARSAADRTHPVYLDAMKLEGTSRAPQWTRCVRWTLGDLVAAVNQVQDCAAGTRNAAPSSFPDGASPSRGEPVPGCSAVPAVHPSSGTKQLSYKPLDDGTNYRVCAQTTTGTWYTFERKDGLVSQGAKDKC